VHQVGLVYRLRLLTFWRLCCSERLLASASNLRPPTSTCSSAGPWRHPSYPSWDRICHLHSCHNHWSTLSLTLLPACFDFSFLAFASAIALGSACSSQSAFSLRLPSRLQTSWGCLELYRSISLRWYWASRQGPHTPAVLRMMALKFQKPLSRPSQISTHCLDLWSDFSWKHRIERQETLRLHLKLLLDSLALLLFLSFSEHQRLLLHHLLPLSAFWFRPSASCRGVWGQSMMLSRCLEARIVLHWWSVGQLLVQTWW